MSDKDLIDRIDELVDASLARPITDDYSVNKFPKCPHCNREFHGIPLTQRIADMYQRGVFDESYRVDTDDSEILCQGSDFIGPMKAPGRAYGVGLAGGRTASLMSYMMETLGIEDLRLDVNAWFGSLIRQHTQQRWWRTQLPDNTTVIQTGDLETNTVTIQIGDDTETFNAENVRSRVDLNHDYVALTQSNRRRQMNNTTLIVDVLAESAPRIGGTWVPLTAPGVTRHPGDLPAPNRGYAMADIEQLRAAGWRDVGALRDDGPSFTTADATRSELRVVYDENEPS